MNLKFWKKAPAEQKEKKKKTPLQEWRDAIVFAVIAATLIRWLFMEAFTIPTPSMENSLLVGDFLFVSKMHYGTRTPKTPLQVPLTHQKIWGTNIPSYTKLIQLPQYRLPGFSSVKRNDVVVFNYPVEFEYPVDLKTNYIKRCVGVPGDVLELKNANLIINGEAQEDPKGMQLSYFLRTNDDLSQKFFEKHKVSEVMSVPGGYQIWTNQDIADALGKLPMIMNVRQLIMPADQVDPRIFPNAGIFGWNRDNYGPLMIPGKGTTIDITKETLATYESVIVHFENNKNVEIKEDELFIDGQKQESYTFKQNYYFMMGDNRHNSEDSRYWGFVPEDHIVGKGYFIWLSIDARASFLNKIRWNRLFNSIK